MKIKEWYTKEYPTDELGLEISEIATFEGLFETLDSYKDVYDYLGDTIDSVIRERCFSELARIMKVDYSEVYSQWLLGN